MVWIELLWSGLNFFGLVSVEIGMSF